MSRSKGNKTVWVYCAECGQNRLHEAHGLCRRCYRRERRKHYHATYGAQRRAAKRRRRARKRNATIEAIDEAAIYERDGYQCIYCPSTEDLTLDHLIPLARGGAHTQDNLAVACRSCNSRKGTKIRGEFLGILFISSWLQTLTDEQRQFVMDL